MIVIPVTVSERKNISVEELAAVILDIIESKTNERGVFVIFDPAEENKELNGFSYFYPDRDVPFAFNQKEDIAFLVKVYEALYWLQNTRRSIVEVNRKGWFFPTTLSLQS